MSKLLALLVVALTMAGCATAPGYQSYYVGNGNLQWFVQPVALEPQDGQTATVDFTYRRLKGQDSFVRVNVTWDYGDVPRGVPVAGFEWSGDQSVTTTDSTVLYQERANKRIRFGGILPESAFLRLAHDPHATLTITTEGHVARFGFSQALIKVLQDLAQELND